MDHCSDPCFMILYFIQGDDRMAMFEGSAGAVAIGAVVGLAAAVLAPVLVPVVVTVGRPLLKGAVKGAIMAYGRGQEVVGELTETIEDLTVEAREEMRTAGTQRAAAAGAPRRRAAAAGGGRKRARRTRAGAAEATTA
jgi:hypothetical protein